MKHINHIAKKISAYTLVEITLVLGLTLMLVAAMMIGITAYQRGADRAQCILNITTAQKALRSFQNMYQFRPGDSVANHRIQGIPQTLKVNIFGRNKFIDAAFNVDNGFQCPTRGRDGETAGSYKVSSDTIFPNVGVMWVTCTLGTTMGHAPRNPEGQ